jgi:hypothetical protein
VVDELRGSFSGGKAEFVFERLLVDQVMAYAKGCLLELLRGASVDSFYFLVGKLSRFLIVSCEG